MAKIEAIVSKAQSQREKVRFAVLYINPCRISVIKPNEEITRIEKRYRFEEILR